MLKTRVMPCLLLQGRRLVKTVQFKKPQYIGDPINTVRIYNEKEVDELIFLDITATVERRRPPFETIEEIAWECFMPFAYGGGIREINDIKTILGLGVEKVVINTHAHTDDTFIRKVADKFGSQSVIASIDARRNRFGGGYRVFTHSGHTRTGMSPIDAARRAEAMGAGEILITSMDRDGTYTGYDTELIRQVAEAVELPVVASGGAGCIEDFGKAVHEGGASAVAAGSLVVYQGQGRGVLINFPSKTELKSILD